MHRRLAYSYIGLGLILVISAFFVANVPLKSQQWPISVLAIMGFTAPVVIGAIQWLGKRHGLWLVTGLGLYALIFETAAIKTGLPYGRFAYGDLLGPHLFQAAPFTVLVAWTPLVLGVLTLNQASRWWQRLLLALSLLVLTDVVLDPAAVKLGFWHWAQPGAYYGVPLINFGGWLVSGAIALGLVELYIRSLGRLKVGPPPRILGYNLIGIIGFWSLVNAFAGQSVPAVIGGALVAFASRQIRYNPASKNVIM